ncbi:hypothetical protein HNQ80_003151 [Anaerosolibacter carboniphilus]|uniref:Uncharacterized protein n=1 Tax=Anaerosolibacter carboniphilus TaxID=1417629 RepID=A0A841KTY3_9FIRM|nr:hypothetical protein [Anaerosolibacter carboniphilus]MBB6217046.1 hypothetical protein [Anaerosolibacter carboniphilus]
MNKKWKSVILIILVVVSFTAFKGGSSPKTIEEVINGLTSNPIIMIHEEKTATGSIAFYTRQGEDSLYTDFFRKGIKGWKYIYGGVRGDAKFFADKFGLTYDYSPNIEGTPFPIYFGIIGNSDIARVMVIEKKRGVEKEAKIIHGNNDTRIWLLYMNEFEGSEFEIVGLSSAGEELSRTKDDISPWFAEQKAIKQ